MQKELAPFQRRPFRTTDRSAVNPGGIHCDKEMAVKSRISRHDRLIALSAIQRHRAKLVWNCVSVSPFSDIKIHNHCGALTPARVKESGVAGVQELQNKTAAFRPVDVINWPPRDEDFDRLSVDRRQYLIPARVFAS